MIHRHANWHPLPAIQIWAWCAGMVLVFFIATCLSVAITWVGEFQKRGGFFR